MLPVSVNIGQPIAHRLDHMMTGIRSEIALKIFGDDLDTMRNTAEGLRAKLVGIPGLTDVQVEKQVLTPQIKEQFIGLAEVRQVFRAPKIGLVAGCFVTEGAVRRNRPIRVLRDNVVIFEGELESLRRFKDDVNEVKAGTECGIAVKNYNDVQVGDQIEVFEKVEVARTL